jgi:hypothetical protein
VSNTDPQYHKGYRALLNHLDPDVMPSTDAAILEDQVEDAITDLLLMAHTHGVDIPRVLRCARRNFLAEVDEGKTFRVVRADTSMTIEPLRTLSGKTYTTRRAAARVAVRLARREWQNSGDLRPPVTLPNYGGAWVEKHQDIPHVKFLVEEVPQEEPT